MASLYAVYESDFKRKYASNPDFYNTYLKKRKNEDNAYYISFKKQLPNKSENKTVLLLIVGLLLGILIVYFIWRNGLGKKKKLQKLSIQERKIYELLREGASNQEISDQCCIGLSTVKSHVSNIYSKLGVKSRKEIMYLGYR